MRAMLAVLVVAVVTLTGCTTSGPSLPRRTPSSSAATCGPPTTLRPDPLQAGAPLGLHLGPLWLRGFAMGATTATISGPVPSNFLTKVLIEHDPGTGTVQLTGTSCATGTPLRFCYVTCRFRAGSSSSMNGPSILQVPIDLAASGYTGYMLFTAPGRYRLSAEYAGNALDSVVVTVRG